MLMRELEVFRAVMQAGSTGRAGTLLGVSQSAVSQALRKFEAQVDFPLFERERYRLVPTPEAIELLAEVDRCFAGLELIEHRMRSLRDAGVSRLRVAAYPAYGTGFMPRAIARMPRSGARAMASLQVMKSRDVYQGVLAGQFDFGLMADEIPVTGLEHHRFASLRGVVVMPAGHRLASQALVRPDDLLGEDFLALNPEDASRRRLEALMAGQARLLTSVMETPYTSSVCELALAGVGIGLANPIVAIDYAERGLVIRPFSLPVMFTCLWVCRAGLPLSVGSKALLRCMRQQLVDDIDRLGRVCGETALLASA